MDRNHRITREILLGESISAVAQKYGISPARARTIMLNRLKRTNKALYAAGLRPKEARVNFASPPLTYLRRHRAAFGFLT